MMEDKKNIISVITQPLGFFALSLLMAESFLGIVLIYSKDPLTTNYNFISIIIGALLFLVVVVLVWIIVWNKPENLTLEGRHHLEIARMKNRILLEEKPQNLSGEVKIKHYTETLNE